MMFLWLMFHTDWMTNQLSAMNTGIQVKIISSQSVSSQSHAADNCTDNN